MLVAHVFAAVGAAGVIWQTQNLGNRAVVSWACWTDFYPALWICIGLIHHILAILFLRLSLKSDDTSTRTRKGAPLLVTQLDMTQGGLDLIVAHTRFASWSKAFVDLLGNVNYLYGTVVFSSLTLVSGVVAIKVLVVYGIVAAVARIMGAWTLGAMGQ